MYLQAYTRGLKNVKQQIEFQVCSTDALTRKSSHASSKIKHIYYKDMADLWHDKERVTQNSEHRQMLQVNECAICSDQSFRLLNFDNTTYTGDRLRLDQAGNIKIKTDKPFREMPLYLESYFKDVANKPNCSFITP